MNLPDKRINWREFIRAYAQKGIRNQYYIPGLRSLDDKRSVQMPDHMSAHV